MSSEAFLTYVRPRRGVVISSSSSKASESNTRPGVSEPFTTERNPTISRDTPQERSSFQDLIVEVVQAMHELIPLGFSSSCTIRLSMDVLDPLKFLGKGKTFYVSKVKLPEGVKIRRSFNMQLVEDTDVINRREEFITSKRPLIELDDEGNSKDLEVDERIKAVKLELQVLKHPQLYLHKNIVDFLGIKWECDLPSFEPGGTIIPGAVMRTPTLLLEYAELGSLDSFIRTERYRSLSFNTRGKLCRDVAEGLQALHQCGIVHGDVKPDNVLIFNEYDADGHRVAFGFRAKITDFGFSIKRSDESRVGTDGSHMWRLKGRTWPWNDPEWESLRTWSQLEKSDVFSYGLLAWSALTGEEIGNLFDLDGIAVTCTDYMELRKIVEDMKDITLGLNTANSFRQQDMSIILLTRCLFDCSLDPDVDRRGKMGDILGIWNTWYFSDPLYQPLPQSMAARPIADVKDQPRVDFDLVTHHMTNFPQYIKQQYTSAVTKPGDGVEMFKATVARVMAHLVGWGVERNPEESKRLLDSENQIAEIAIFQPMFLRVAKVGERNLAMGYAEKCTPYEQGIFSRLEGLSRRSPCVEAVLQLRRYFPYPSQGTKTGAYSLLRCEAYRTWKYGIDGGVNPHKKHKELGGDLCAWELEDILANQPTISSSIGHGELHFAVFSGFAGAIELFLDSYDFDPGSLESRDYNGDTPLFSACRLGLFTIAKLFINAGANVKARNNYGETILHFLDSFDDPEELIKISDMIFEAGAADLINDACDERSYPDQPIKYMPDMTGVPLNTAILRNNLVLVRILLQHGPDHMPYANAKTWPGNVAASGHFAEILGILWNTNGWREMFATPGNELLTNAIWGFSQFRRAYIHGTRAKEMMQRTLRFLLDRAVLTRGKILLINKRTILHHAIEYGNADMVELIISHIGNSEINTYCSAKTPLHHVMLSGDYDIFQVLLQNGADPSMYASDRSRAPLLNFCCTSWNDYTMIIKSLLTINPRPDGIIGYSGLWGAVSTCNFKAASLLLEAGVDINWGEPTILGMLLTHPTTNIISQLKFVFEHQTAIGRKPASFICYPSDGLTALHLLGILPGKAPLYDRGLMSSMLDYLLDRFPSPQHINAVDERGSTPLHLAACSANFKMVQRLLDIDFVDLEIRNKFHETACEAATGAAMLEQSRVVGWLGDQAVNRYRADMCEVINLFYRNLGMEVDLEDLRMISSVDMNDGTGRKVYMIEAKVVQEDAIGKES